MELKIRKYTVLDNLRIPFQCAPVWMTLRMIILIFTKLCAVFQVLVMARFIDSALQVLAGAAGISGLVFPLAGLCLIVGWTQWSEPLRLAVNCKIENQLRIQFRSEITNKRAAMIYAKVEDHETWDLIMRVSKEPEKSVENGIGATEGIGGILVQTVGLMAVIWANVWWAAIAIVAVSIPTLIVAIKSGKAHYEADRKVTEIERRHEYLSEMMLSRDALDERELFRTADQFAPRWKALYQQARKQRLVVEKHWLIKSKISGFAVSLLTIIITLILINPLSKGTITIGLFIALIQAISSMITMMTWEFTQNVDKFTQSGEYFKDVTAFMEIPETKDAKEIPAETDFAFESLEFREVSFRYPGTDKLILDKMSFIMKAGGHYAIVGANGAGKTTLTKLILGLYTDFEGEILINNRPYQEYSYPDIKKIVSVLFQDFGQYALSMRDNIAIGDIRNINREDMDERVMKAAGEMHLNDTINGLHSGIDTRLGKIETDSLDLSGGQWQRVAMARTMLSRAPLRILDEPTSALDPISESELYKEFGRVSKSAAIIFISHRLGSTKLADEILVVEQGRIAEQGTHEGLMRLGGLYSQMYENQRNWYQ